MTCPRCGAPAAQGSRFCSSCGARLSTADATTFTSDPAAPHARTPSRESSGWLSASASIDHGRFPPGTILNGRYRIIGLIGCGGMGQVFRADDLRLGQPIALKFLRPDLARDPPRLAQLHSEVRTARQVSHPNVCRVYDIAEVDGEIYLTMEYVDGESLAASLRRVGRFPEDKATELARDICAGLAAAHERGVIHRDLKPGNIMLDEAGRARLMDFGLAAPGTVDDIHAGTPAYMSPEQIEGREVTAKSDIYALGLVLYELFTGRSAFAAATVADLVLQHASGELTPPSQFVKGLDPVIERTIMRCLEADPARRPASAHVVAAGFPGGDPLAAALAAGETPSPAMVAAAGGEGPTLTLRQGAALIVSLMALVWLTGWLADRGTEPGRLNMRRPASVLAEDARRARAAAGYRDPAAYEAYGFLYNNPVMHWYAANGGPAERWQRLDGGRIPAVTFWYRTSNSRLDPLDPSVNIQRDDPPRLFRIGDSIIDVATDGRLLRFVVVPPRRRTAALPPMMPAQWEPLFSAAGLDFSRFAPAASEWEPQSYADQRFAWVGTAADSSDIRLRIDASAAGGRPVWFEVTGPWQTTAPQSMFAWLVPYLALTSALLQVTLLGTVLVLAVSNARAGRLDFQAAWRIAAVTFASNMLTWVFGHHSSDPLIELERFFAGSGAALFRAAAFGVAFLGIEPYVRRYFPHALVGATRLLAGRWRDPVVGRDVLVGVTWGMLIVVVALSYPVVPQVVDQTSPAPWRTLLRPATSPAATIAFALSFTTPLVNSLAAMVLVALLRRYLSLTWLAMVGAAIVITLIDNPALGNFHGHQLQLLAMGFVVQLLTVVIFVRYGLLAGVAANYARILTGAAFTLDSGRAYFHSSVTIAAVIAALGMIGWRMSRTSDVTSSLSPAAGPARSPAR